MRQRLRLMVTSFARRVHGHTLVWCTCCCVFKMAAIADNLRKKFIIITKYLLNKNSCWSVVEIEMKKMSAQMLFVCLFSSFYIYCTFDYDISTWFWPTFIVIFVLLNCMRVYTSARHKHKHTYTLVVTHAHELLSMCLYVCGLVGFFFLFGSLLCTNGTAFLLTPIVAISACLHACMYVAFVKWTYTPTHTTAFCH